MLRIVLPEAGTWGHLSSIFRSSLSEGCISPFTLRVCRDRSWGASKSPQAEKKKDAGSWGWKQPITLWVNSSGPREYGAGHQQHMLHSWWKKSWGRPLMAFSISKDSNSRDHFFSRISTEALGVPLIGQTHVTWPFLGQSLCLEWSILSHWDVWSDHCSNSHLLRMGQGWLPETMGRRKSCPYNHWIWSWGWEDGGRF